MDWERERERGREGGGVRRREREREREIMQPALSNPPAAEKRRKEGRKEKPC